MVRLPLRSAVPLFGATVTLTVPFPVPLEPDEMVTNEELLVAVHVQVLPCVTVTFATLDPPLALTVIAVGLTAN